MPYVLYLWEIQGLFKGNFGIFHAVGSPEAGPEMKIHVKTIYFHVKIISP